MYSSIRKAFLYVAFAPLLLLTTSTATHSDSRPPSLGLLLPLSGALAEWGNAMRMGVEMAVTESGSGVRLLVEDTQFQPSVALSACEKMIQSEKPDALIVFGSGVSLAIAPRAERELIPMISLATSDDIQKGKKYVFRLMMSGDAATNTLLPEVQRRNLSRIAAVSTTQDGMLAYQRSFVSAAGDSVIYTTDVAPTERDFNSLIAKILSLKVDGIYSTLLPPQGSLFANQARKLGFKGQLFSANQVELASEIAAGGAAFEGLFFAADGDSSREKFEARFLAHHKVPADNMAGLAFDAVQILLRALETEDAAASIASIKDFSGVLGVYQARPDHTFSIPSHIRTIHKGKALR